MLSPPPAYGGSAWWLQSGKLTSASNLQHEIGCRMRQMSLSGQPDVHYFVNHCINGPSQSMAALRWASSFRDDRARYRVCQKFPPQTINSSPVDAEQIGSQNRALLRKRSSPQWPEDICYFFRSANCFLGNRHCRS
ncbi:hypothetical protein BVI2075_840014 [Burkholderia vietnamiensis]|nr:hypothetical protein BVI2075_840014 [Burkholderia vietnamiensis]